MPLRGHGFTGCEKTLASVEAALRRHLVGGHGAAEPVKTPVAREGTTLQLAEELFFYHSERSLQSEESLFSWVFANERSSLRWE
jgi:hypothetical protein